MLHRGIGAGAVAGGEEVEEQPARHGQVEARLRGSHLGRHPLGMPHLGDRSEPRLDDVVQEVDGVGPGLEGLGVGLEEEALVGPQRRVGELLPHPAGDVGGGERRVGVERGHGPALLLLDRADDRDQEPLLRSEVVDQHPVAGTDGPGQAPEAQLRHPVLPDVVDRGLEEPLRELGGSVT